MSAILLLVAVVIFVLGALGVDVGDANSHQLVSAGLAFFAASFLAGPLVAYVGSHRKDG